MFYTDLTVYPHIPDKEIILDLSGQGYTVLVNDDGTLPSYILDTDLLIKVKLTKPAKH